MTVKDFSPIQSDTVYIDPNSNDYLGSEIYFSDSNSILYCLITREKEDGDFYLMNYSILNGYNNSTDYDYRIDINNYIWNPHLDIFIEDNIDFYSFELPLNHSNFSIMIGTTDFMLESGFISYISTLSNGEMYITNISGANSYVDYNFNFKVIDNKMSIPSYPFVSNLLNNSYFVIGLGPNTVPEPTTTTTTTNTP